MQPHCFFLYKVKEEKKINEQLYESNLTRKVINTRLGVSTRRDVVFQTVEKISTVEMSFFKLSRSRQKSRNLDFQGSRDCRDLVFELSRCRFSNCRKNLDCRDVLFQTVEIETLDRDTIETNRDPQGYYKHKIKSVQNCKVANI